MHIYCLPRPVISNPDCVCLFFYYTIGSCILFKRTFFGLYAEIYQGSVASILGATTYGWCNSHETA